MVRLLSCHLNLSQWSIQLIKNVSCCLFISQPKLFLHIDCQSQICICLNHSDDFKWLLNGWVSLTWSVMRNTNSIKKKKKYFPWVSVYSILHLSLCVFQFGTSVSYLAWIWCNWALESNVLGSGLGSLILKEALVWLLFFKNSLIWLEPENWSDFTGFLVSFWRIKTIGRGSEWLAYITPPTRAGLRLCFITPIGRF